MSLYSKWAQKEHTEAKRILATLPAGVIFVYLLPLAIARGGSSLDQQIGLHPFDLGTINYILGGLLMVVGFFFALWSIVAQFSRGRGTPLPILPTQKLLIDGPFR